MQLATPMPPPSASAGSELGVRRVAGRPVLYLLALLLFLYVACEVGFSTWLGRLLIARGMQESQALDALTAFAFGILVGRVAVRGFCSG